MASKILLFPWSTCPKTEHIGLLSIIGSSFIWLWSIDAFKNNPYLPSIMDDNLDLKELTEGAVSFSSFKMK
jgi:hypothetical protein